MLALSFLAGALTSLSPCVLPLIPILLGSALQEHAAGPLALTVGLALSFAALGVALASIGFAIGLDADVVRSGAAVVMACFGVVLFSAALKERFALVGAPLGNRAGAVLAAAGKAGLPGQFLLGLLLGLVWAPCAGPTLGAAVGLAASSGTAPRAALMMTLFGFGAAAPILALAYASRRWAGAGRQRLRALASVAKPAMGCVLLAVGLIVLTGIDKLVETALTRAMPHWLLDITTRI
jgi:cytochrome c biogenesis protein CcdA